MDKKPKRKRGYVVTYKYDDGAERWYTRTELWEMNPPPAPEPEPNWREYAWA